MAHFSRIYMLTKISQRFEGWNTQGAMTAQPTSLHGKQVGYGPYQKWS